MFSKIIKPTLLLDKTKCLANIKKMTEKPHNQGVALRPHFKTHQSAQIGEWFRAEGVRQITVSSNDMASFFAQAGWEDILIAFPLNIRQLPLVNELANSVNLSVFVVSVQTAELLAAQATSALSVYIEIDAGYRRTGVNADDLKTVKAIIAAIEKNKLLTFKGFYAPAGNTYFTGSIEGVRQIHVATRAALEKLKQQFSAQYPHIELVTGDTPSCSIVENFEGLSAISPGNFVFYDLMQQTFGACTFEQIAVAMACPVVAVYPERNEVVIYGGAVHFSKEFLTDKQGQRYFGKMVRLSEQGWGEPLEDCFLKNISQEHGILQLTRSEIRKIKVGDLVGILPVHSCLTANLMKSYLTLEGEYIEVMPSIFH